MAPNSTISETEMARSKKKEQSFDAWFREQAGKAPMSEPQYITLLHKTVPDLRRRLEQEERKLREMERYRTARQYALYAWTSK